MRTFGGQNIPNTNTTGEFPEGTVKDDSPLGSKTGTPLTEKAGAVDVYNAVVNMIKEAGIPLNEQPEKQVGLSQFFEALKVLFPRTDVKTFNVRFTLNDVPNGAIKTDAAVAYYSGGTVTLFIESIGNQVVGTTGDVVGIALVDAAGAIVTDLGFAAPSNQYIPQTATLDNSGAANEKLGMMQPGFAQGVFLFQYNDGTGDNTFWVTEADTDVVTLVEPTGLIYRSAAPLS